MQEALIAKRTKEEGLNYYKIKGPRSASDRTSAWQELAQKGNFHQPYSQSRINPALDTPSAVAIRRGTSEEAGLTYADTTGPPLPDEGGKNNDEIGQ